MRPNRRRLDSTHFYLVHGLGDSTTRFSRIIRLIDSRLFGLEVSELFPWSHGPSAVWCELLYSTLFIFVFAAWSTEYLGLRVMRMSVASHRILSRIIPCCCFGWLVPWIPYRYLPQCRHHLPTYRELILVLFPCTRPRRGP